MALVQHRQVVRKLLRVEKARKGVPFKVISEALKKHGIHQSPANLTNKMAAGRMEAGLLLAILDVLGVQKIEIPDLFEDVKREQRG